MAYVKNTWAKGDIITATKLNHMEDGIADGGSGEFTTYHVTVNAVMASEGGYIEGGTIQTDLPGVTDWASFESVCRELAEGPNQLYFRVNITAESGVYVEHPTYQFMGLINIPNDTVVSVGVWGDDCFFKMGNSDGIYRHIVLRYSTESYELGLEEYTFVS
jgi:hypothetical protein